MITVDGTALALEPGKHYLLVYDVERIDDSTIGELTVQLLKSGIFTYLLPAAGRVDCVRVVQVEQAQALNRYSHFLDGAGAPVARVSLDLEADALLAGGWQRVPGPVEDGRLLWQAPNGNQVLGTHNAWLHHRKIREEEAGAGTLL